MKQRHCFQTISPPAVIFIAIFFGMQAYAQSTFRPEIYSVLGENRSTALLRLGSIHIHGVLGLHVTRDSNVLFEDTNPKPDFVFDIIPGVDIIRKSERLLLIASYRYKYRDNLKYNIQDYQAHNFSGSIDWEFARRISLLVKEDFEKSADAADVEIPERVGRWTNAAQMGVRHRTPAEDLETTLTYVNVMQSFDNPLENVGVFQNKFILSSRVNVNSSFRFLPKSVLSGSVEYGDTHFEQGGVPAGTPVVAQNSDSHGMSFSLGLNSVLSRKLTYLATLGYSFISFDQGESGNQLIGQLSIKYFPTQKITGSLGYKRGLKVSTFTNYYAEHEISADLVYKPSTKFDAHTRHSLSFIDYSGPNTTFLGENRSDQLYQGLFGVTYRWLPCLSTILDYSAILRESNAVAQNTPTKTASFLKHLVTFSLDLYY